MRRANEQRPRAPLALSTLSEARARPQLPLLVNPIAEPREVTTRRRHQPDFSADASSNR